jgi:geranylgeranyl diphosphate synthase type II
MLHKYGEITHRAMLAYLNGGEPKQYLYDLASDYPRRAGKMMRASLCIATARAFGANLKEALPTAVAIELLHNALLIHDDIEDDSERRRGQPTLHLKYGVPLALNAGDLLMLTSLRPLLVNRNYLGSDLAMRILEEAQRMARESAEGQALELGWRHEVSCQPDETDYLEMVLKKTCWLAAIFPARIGALIATRGRIDLDPFVRFGFFLGAAFQIKDDLLNLDPDGAYGKEANGDLFEGKRTLMLIHLLRHASKAERERLQSILSASRKARTSAHIQWIRRLMDKRSSIVYARAIAEQLAAAAAHECAQIYGELPDSPDRRFLQAMPRWVIDRA